MKKLEKLIASIVTFIGVALLLIIFLNVIAQIAFRDIFQISAPWTEEMARFAFIWMVYFGTVAVHAHKEHIKMDFILNKIAWPLRNVLLKVFDVAAIVFLLVIFIGSINMLEHASRTPLSVVMPWLKASFLYIPLIITMPLNILFLMTGLFSPRSIEAKEGGT